MQYQTDQEAFWAGEFGDNYIQRNKSAELLAANLSFFSRALRYAGKIKDCLEFGANIGMNLKALQLLFPEMTACGVEINDKAASELRRVLCDENVHNCSILQYEPVRQFDLVLVKGVLIHMSPDKLKEIYGKLVASTKAYLLVAEYYNPTPIALSYRGHEGKLFKRDFAGEILDLYPSMRLVDYGFAYHRDQAFKQDDINWFLMKNTKAELA